jgi:rRNA-processing protein FCF1
MQCKGKAVEKGKGVLGCEGSPFGKPAKVAFDANMLLAIPEHKVDVFSEAEKMFGKTAELVVPEKVVLELKSLSGQGRKMEKGVEMVFSEIKRHSVREIQASGENADKVLENLAKEGYFVATNDAALRKRIKGFAGKVIYLRQLRFFELG